jgi:hypothetical protein
MVLTIAYMIGVMRASNSDRLNPAGPAGPVGYRDTPEWPSPPKTCDVWPLVEYVQSPPKDSGARKGSSV